MIVTEDYVITPGWRAGKGQLQPRLMVESSECRGSESAGGRREVLGILSPNASTVRGM